MGTFELQDGSGAKYLQCNAAQDSLTHLRADEKTVVKAIWRPGSDLTGQVLQRIFDDQKNEKELSYSKEFSFDRCTPLQLS